MNSNQTPTQTAPFAELHSVTISQQDKNIFDIVIDEEVNLDSYCAALINKVFELNPTKFSSFINYQVNLVKCKNKWLNKFEILLANSETLFASKTAFSRYNKLFNLIEQKRIELKSTSVNEVPSKTPKRFINTESEDRYFSFYEVKKHVNSLNCFSEKVIYLTDEICEYKEAEILFTNTKLLDYKKQCKTLLRRIRADKELKTQLVREQEEEYTKSNAAAKPGLKIQINGPINIITYAFKQMMVNVKPNGTPYIQYKIKDVAQFICDNFTDENGQALSNVTIQTYLSPNRTDKDPNKDTTIKF